MPGYGMAGADPKTAAAINALAQKNTTANTAIGYKPTHTTQQAAAQKNATVNYVNNAAKFMPSVNSKAQTGAKQVTNQSAGNDDAKKAMLAWGGAFMQPGAQLTGSAANQFTTQNSLLKDTSTGSTWRAYQPGGEFYGLLGGGGSGGSGAAPGGGIGSSLGGGGLGGLGSMMGGMGGLGSMMGGGGMGGIGDALGGALGGGGGGGAPAEEEKEKDKPIPQRHWAGGYNSTQQAAMDEAGTNSQRAKLKAQYDVENVNAFKGMQGYDDLQKDRVKQAQQLAERQGGQYDTEGNFYNRDAAQSAINNENQKRAQAAANYYDIPDGAVPIAGNEGDKTPPGSTPAAGSGSGSGGGKEGKGSSKLDDDWLKKLGGMAASWFGGG